VLTSSLRSVDPLSGISQSAVARDVFANEILDVAVRRVHAHLADEPLVQAEIEDAFGQIYGNIGKLAEAETLLESSLAIRRRLLPPDDPLIADSLSHLADVLGDMEEAARASEAITEAIGIYEKSLPPTHPKISAAYTHLGLYHLKSDRLDDAFVAFEQAGVSKLKTPGHQHSFYATTLNGIAGVLNAQLKHTDAEQVLRKAIDLALTDGKEESTLVSSLRNNLAWVLLALNRHDEAMEQGSISLESRRKILDAEHFKISDSLLVLGVITAESGRPLDAEPMLRDALRIRRKAIPDSKALIGEAQAALATCLRYQGRFDDGEPFMVDGVRGLREGYGDTHADTQLALGHAVRFFLACEKFDRAEEYRKLIIDKSRDGFARPR